MIKLRRLGWVSISYHLFSKFPAVGVNLCNRGIWPLPLWKVKITSMDDYYDGSLSWVSTLLFIDMYHDDLAMCLLTSQKGDTMSGWFQVAMSSSPQLRSVPNSCWWLVGGSATRCYPIYWDDHPFAGFCSEPVVISWNDIAGFKRGWWDMLQIHSTIVMGTFHG